MPSAFIFTVNETTFKAHLEYRFAGTGKDGADHQGGAMADILSLREGDLIIFYVMFHGFYGFFKVVSTPFYEAPENQYLDGELNHKTLTYRVKIKPHQLGVYELGKNEWEVIENPCNIPEQSIFKMQWSWIFKKLKGNRGCTAIPPDEFDILKDIIISNNTRLGDSAYSYIDGKIVTSANRRVYTASTTTKIRPCEELYRIKTEEDLRIFFCKEIGINNIFEPILGEDNIRNISFVANEVVCSFGEKRIDLIIFNNKNDCFLIELKKNFVIDQKVADQIAGYSKWMANYKHHIRKIYPIIVIGKQREVKSGNSKYHIYDSEEDKRINRYSDYYRRVLEKKDSINNKFASYNIEKTEPPKFFNYVLNEQGFLTKFELI